MAKLTIATLDHTSNFEVEAQYNPKEIGLEKAVTWGQAKNPKGNTPTLEFTSGTNRTLSLELTFDTYEDGKSVADSVDKLISMANVIDKNATQDDKKRPPRVSVCWGGEGAFPNFKGVVESVSTKYTMFLPDGTPVRATCNIKVKEAEDVKFKKGS